MKTFLSIVSFLTLAFISASNAQAADDLNQLKQASLDAIASFKKADSTLTPNFDKASGYVVFPKVGKGGFIVGGAHGQGIVYAKSQPIGKASLSQATIGAQIGGQVFREVIFFESQESLEAFKKSNFEMAAQVGAVAAAEGAGQNAKYRDGVLVFTQPVKGLMAEASIGGQKFKFEALP